MEVDIMTRFSGKDGLLRGLLETGEEVGGLV
jgi:hypothetical protein